MTACARIGRYNSIGLDCASVHRYVASKVVCLVLTLLRIACESVRMISVVTRYARDLEKHSGRTWTDENTLMKDV